MPGKGNSGILRACQKRRALSGLTKIIIIALNLYFKLPFGKLHKGNPLIIDVAKKMGRTPSSLAIKLCNFASLDSILKARGIRGMSGSRFE